MENAAGGASVVFGVVQNALLHAVGIHDLRFKNVAVGGQGQHAAESRSVQQKPLPGKFNRNAAINIFQIIIQEFFNAAVGGAGVIEQQAIFFLKISQKGFGNL